MAFLFLCSFASTQTFAKDKIDEPLYINESLFDLDSTIPPPPGPGTMEYKYEIEFMKAKIAKLNEAQKALAISDATNETVAFFTDTISSFDIANLPKTKALFEKVKFNAEYETELFKNHFTTKRPYQIDPEIHVCIPPKLSSLNRSYPSGHATKGYAMSIVLAELIPQKSKEIMERARLYGENRINCGAHFPVDVAGGQVLGTLVAKELINNKEFKLLMNEVRDELVEVGLTQ